MTVYKSTDVTSNTNYVTRSTLLITLPLPPMPPRSRSKQTAAAQKKRRRDEPVSEDEGYHGSSAEDDDRALDSDNLDDDDVDTEKQRKKVGEKRKKKASPAKPVKRSKKAGLDEEESDLELKEGQEIVGKVVRAPKTGQGKLQTPQKRIRLKDFPSPSRPDLSEHVQFPEPAQTTRVQRPGMVGPYLGSSPLTPLTS